MSYINLCFNEILELKDQFLKSQFIIIFQTYSEICSGLDTLFGTEGM